MAAGNRLAGATVLVTGGGSGIGRLMAIGAASRGARVVVWDVSAERGERVRDDIVAAGGTAWSQTVDVSDPDAVQVAAAEVDGMLGAPAAALASPAPAAAAGVDVVVNNAGVVSGQRLLEASREAIERTLDINVKALYWVTRAFLPGMVERDRGTVVTIASAAGLVGVARQTDYSASKFAALGFDESLRAELRVAGSAVRTLVVCPYYIDTGMFAGVRTRVPWLLPILEEHAVATTVLDGVETGRRRIVLPPAVRLLPVLRALPVGLFDRVNDLLGVNRTMDHFAGRPGDVAGAAAGDQAGEAADDQAGEPARDAPRRRPAGPGTP